MKHLSQETIFEFIEQSVANEKLTQIELHLTSCESCRQEVATARVLTEDILDMETPQVSSGFALRTAQKINALETDHVFDKPIFKLFKTSIAFSLIVAVAAVMLRLANVQVALPVISIAGLGYYVVGICCLIVMLIVDKVLFKRCKT